MSNEPLRGVSPFYGIPVIRSGDKVFFVTPPSPQIEFDKRMELMGLSFDHYRCPFSILDEFDQWFEWHERLYHRKQSTGTIITTMLSDVKRIKEHKSERKIEFTLRYDDTFYSIARSLGIPTHLISST